MFRYRNEAAFSSAFCKLLRDHNWFVQRIETGTTGKGVPDIYAVSPTHRAIWFELKRIHCDADKFHASHIPWRPGQQAWMHNVVANYHQRAMTVACFDNMIMVIKHNKHYKEDRVWITDPDVSIYFKLSDLL